MWQMSLGVGLGPPVYTALEPCRDHGYAQCHAGERRAGSDFRRRVEAASRLRYRWRQLTHMVRPVRRRIAG